MSDEVAQGREPSRAPRPGASRRRTLLAGAVVVAAAVAGGVVWSTRHDAPRPAPPATTSTPAQVAGPPLQLTATRCARLTG